MIRVLLSDVLVALVAFVSVAALGWLWLWPVKESP